MLRIAREGAAERDGRLKVTVCVCVSEREREGGREREGEVSKIDSFCNLSLIVSIKFGPQFTNPLSTGWR